MDESNPNWYTHAIDINFQRFQIHSERMSITNKCFNILNTKQRPGFDPRVRKIPWRREWQSTPVFLPGKSHGQRSVVGYSPWGCKESDMTEGLTLQASTICKLEKNQNRLTWQCRNFILQLKRSELEWLANSVDTLHHNESFFLRFFSAYMYVD